MLLRMLLFRDKIKNNNKLSWSSSGKKDVVIQVYTGKKGVY
jgi:hypothetical protein